MIENQEIEFKVIWKDEWLQWICGFANTKGGTMYIGVDDTGKVIGLDKAGDLLDKLPNKIKDCLGIVPEIELKSENGKEYIVIQIDKYPVLISYNGKYYLRSGRSNHVATSAEVERITLRKMGYRRIYENRIFQTK